MWYLPRLGEAGPIPHLKEIPLHGISFLFLLSRKLITLQEGILWAFIGALHNASISLARMKTRPRIARSLGVD